MNTALVTGASRGIGHAIAATLSANGIAVIGVARTAPESFPGRFIRTDLSSATDTAALLEELQAGPDIDYLVNNLGAVSNESLTDLRLESLAATLDLNVRVSAQLASGLAGGMIARGRGRIVNLSSVTALGAPNRTSYTAAKAAVNAMTRCWAAELAPHGITVNTVAPGPVETEMFRSVHPVGSESEGRFLSQLPLGRLGRPEEIAALVRFLLSPEAGFITGQTIFADGGFSVGRQF